MGALPRADIPPGPHRELVDSLHSLHHRAGWPSLRTLARGVGCSPTTVSAVFSSARVPSWGVLELLVEAMDGEVADFHALWVSATTVASGGAPVARIAGRTAELAAVRSHLARGDDGVLLVTGEAGIGKSRLASTAAELVDDTTFVAPGWCLPLSSDVPLLAVSDVFRAVHGFDRGGWLSRTLDGCPRYVAPTLARVVPELDAPGDAARDGHAGAATLFGAVASALSGLARERPLAIVLEDLHWADSATLDLLEYLAVRRVGRIVATWRSEDPATPATTVDWCTRLRRLPGVQVVELGTLDAEGTADQLAMLGVRDPALVDRIRGRSQGLPLFTEQLAAHLGEDDETLPAVLEQLLDRRLDQLDGRAWVIARILGVADRAISAPLLAEATRLPETALSAGLRELADRRLLAPAAGHEVVLRHPLLAEAIRRRLTVPELVTDHRRLGAVLGGVPRCAAAEVAEHWERAGEPAEELGWRIRAAQQAAERHAPAQEADQWRRAIAVWPEDLAASASGLRKLDAYLAAVGALMPIDVAAAREVAGEAMDAYPRLTGLDAADLYRRVAEAQGLAGDPEGAIELVDRAIRIYESLAPSAGHVHALTLRDVLTWGLDRRAEGVAACVSGVEISAELGDVALHRQMLALQAAHDADDGRLATALERLRTAAALREAGPDPDVDVLAALLHTDILLTAEAGADEVVAAGRPGVDAIRDWGLETGWAATLQANIGEALRRAGRVEEAAELVDPVTDGPTSSHQWALHAERAVLDLLRGRYLDATSRIRAVSEVYYLDVSGRVNIVNDVALIDLWCGRPDAAYLHAVQGLREFGAEHDEMTDIGGLLVLAARAAADLAAHGSTRERDERCGEIGDLLARTAYDPFAPHRAVVVRPALAATWAAETARLGGRPDLTLWSAAATQWDRLTRPHDAAYCRWRAAEVAAATGRRTLATRILRHAARDARGHAPQLAAIGATLTR